MYGYRKREISNYSQTLRLSLTTWRKNAYLFFDDSVKLLEDEPVAPKSHLGLLTLLSARCGARCGG